MEDVLARNHPSSVTKWRERRRRPGFARVEVQVRKEDASLVRDVAAALVGPERAAETRAISRERITAPRAGGLKAPLDGIDLERSRELGRDTALWPS